jgi:hypothetical protein
MHHRKDEFSSSFPGKIHPAIFPLSPGMAPREAPLPAPGLASCLQADIIVWRQFSVFGFRVSVIKINEELLSPVGIMADPPRECLIADF